MKLSHIACILLTAATSAFAADDPDPASLYELSTEGSTGKLKAGEKGKLVVLIKTKGGSHVSEEAPMKIELSATGVKLDKVKLAAADNVAKKKEGDKWVDPRFEAPFTAQGAGKGNVDAKVTFFICTEKICARQQKKLAVPVTIE